MKCTVYKPVRSASWSPFPAWKPLTIAVHSQKIPLTLADEGPGPFGNRSGGAQERDTSEAVPRGASGVWQLLSGQEE